MSIELKRDKKSPTWIVTKTDSEGFHHQITLNRDEIFELYCKIIKTDFRCYDEESGRKKKE